MRSSSVSFQSLTRSFSSTIQASPAGRLLAFGTHANGRLGTGPVQEKDIDVPEPVRFETKPGAPEYTEESVSLLSAGGVHSLAVSTQGKLYSWGKAHYGVLGQPTKSKDLFVATELPRSAFAQTDASCSIRSIAAGPWASAVAFSDGKLYTWGWGGSFLMGDGPLGHGNRRSVASPKVVAGLEGEDVVRVSLGQAHAVCVLASGEAFSWGKGNWGRLGLGTSFSSSTPAYMITMKDVALQDVACGQTHSIALSREGEVFVWGKNDHFQLGIDSSGSYYGGAGFDAQSAPARMPFFEDKPVAQISANTFFSACITRDGRAYVWGNRQLMAPTRIILGRNANEKAVCVSTGPEHVGIVSESGKLYMFGKNSNLQLGHPKKNTKKEFVLAESVQFPVSAVACGGGFSLVVQKDEPASQ